MLIAGEASGDQRGAEVAQALLVMQPQLTLFGIGGQHMRAAGVATMIDVNELAVIGFFEVLKHLPRILKIFYRMKRVLQENRPDLLILIDYPGFNLRFAKVAKRLKIPVLFYISPQVWAWRQHRVKKIAQVIDHMAVIFPFEKQFYQQQNIPVTYVGHPLTQKINRAPTMAEARKKLAFDLDNKIISLLPGSRRSEIERLLPTMLDAAEELTKKIPGLIFLLAVATTVDSEKIKALLQNSRINIRILQNDAYATMSAADVVLTASGTATLEAALLNKPMVVLYKVNRFTAAILKRMLKIPYVSLCNIVAGEKVVTELLQADATADNLVKETMLLLNDTQRQQQIKAKLSSIKAKLGEMNAEHNVAQIAIQMLTR